MESAMERTNRSRPSMLCISSFSSTFTIFSSEGSMIFSCHVSGNAHRVIQYPGSPRTTRDPTIMRGMWSHENCASPYIQTPVTTRRIRERISKNRVDFFIVFIIGNSEYLSISILVKSANLTSIYRTIPFR